MSSARRVVHEGHQPRPLQEEATSWDSPHRPRTSPHLHEAAAQVVVAMGLAYAHLGFIAPRVPRSVLIAAGLGKAIAVVLWLEMLTQGLGTMLPPARSPSTGRSACCSW